MYKKEILGHVKEHQTPVVAVMHTAVKLCQNKSTKHQHWMRQSNCVTFWCEGRAAERSQHRTHTDLAVLRKVQIVELLTCWWKCVLKQSQFNSSYVDLLIL